MAKLKYIKELLSFIGALVLACIGWAFSYKTLLLPLTAFLIVLVIAIIIWLVSNVVFLIKDNDNKSRKIEKFIKENNNKNRKIETLKNGLAATKKARDEAQKERDSLENKYYHLNNNLEQFKSVLKVIMMLLPTADLEDKNGKREKNIQDSSDR